jgi:secondary thiamine-phosphate synthase enzyme
LEDLRGPAYRINQPDHKFVDITAKIRRCNGGLVDGVLHVFCPHTTAGLAVNENWDPDVKRDMLLTLNEEIAPPDKRHRHAEGNSPAHIKASLMGASLAVFVEEGKVLLGRWQGIYLAEFDGPRRRQIWLKFMGE